MAEPLLSVKDLSLSVKGQKILASLDFEVQRGHVTAIVGESGAGKTMTLRTIIGLLPEMSRIDSGLIMFGHENLLLLSGKEREALRGREISMVSQNPLSSFNPYYRISHHFRLLCRKSGHMWPEYADRILSSLSINDARRILSSYPDQLSGGTLQRLSLAASLLLEPHLLLLDEPTSALDLSIGNEIYRYLSEYRESHDITMLLVTHDLGRAAGFADDIAVMHGGTIVERSDIYEFFRLPMHPYSRMLLEAASSFKAAADDHAAVTDGSCPFYAHCRYKMRICKELAPELKEVAPGHYVACFNMVDKICK